MLACTPSTAVLAVPLALRASHCLFEAHSTRWHLIKRCPSRLDLPSLRTATTSVVCVIKERVSPRGVLVPTSARALCSLALRASFCLNEAQAILLVSSYIIVRLYFPHLATASTSILVSLSLLYLQTTESKRDWINPSTASVRWSRTLRTAFCFLQANPESMISLALWHQTDNRQNNYQTSVWQKNHFHAFSLSFESVVSWQAQ